MAIETARTYSRGGGYGRGPLADRPAAGMVPEGYVYVARDAAGSPRAYLNARDAAGTGWQWISVGMPPVAVAGPFSDANYFSSAGGPEAGANVTLAVMFMPDASPSGERITWSHGSALGNGFFFTFEANNRNVLVNRAGTQFNIGNTGADFSIPHVAVFGVNGAGNQARYAVDAAAIASTAVGAYVAAGAATHAIGRLGYSAGFALTDGGVLAVIAIPALLSDADLQRLAQSGPAGAFPSDLVAQASLHWAAGKHYTPGQPTSPTEGTSGLVLTVNGAPGKVPYPDPALVKRLDVIATPALLSSNLEDVSEGGGAWHRHSPLARAKFTTTTASRLLLKYATTIAAQFVQFPELRVLIDGVAQSVTGWYDNAVLAQQIRLTAGAHTVEIVEGLQSKPGAILGTYLVSVSADNGDALPVVHPAATPRVAAVGDSLVVGGNSTHPGTDAYLALLRAQADTVIIGHGFDAWNDDIGTAPGRAALAALIASANPTHVLLARGVNDFLRPTTSAATLRTNFAAFLTVLRAATAAPVYVLTPFLLTAPASEAANGFGDNLGAYRTALVNGRTDAAIANCFLLDGTTYTSGVQATDYVADGIHLITGVAGSPGTGHARVYGHLRAALGM